MAHYVADEALWLNADRTKVVKEGDPDAAFLFATPGKRISVEDAELYGLAKLAYEESPKEMKPGANKAIEGPQATKAAAALAEEKGVDLAEIEGSGADGRVLVGDVEAVEAPPSAPKEDPLAQVPDDVIAAVRKHAEKKTGAQMAAERREREAAPKKGKK